MNTLTRQVEIIIVDDNQIFRTVLRNFLQNELQYRIIGEACSGDDFLSMNNIPKADVILMDLQMPGMDGYEVAQKAIQAYPAIKIIAITMYTEKAYITDLLQTGFKGCVFKPEIYLNIEQTIDKVLNNQNCFWDEISL